MEMFADALAAGDIDAAKALMAPDAMVVQYDDFAGQTERQPLWILLSKTAKMKRIADYAEFRQTEEGRALSYYDQGVAFGFGENARFPNTRLMVEFEIKDGSVMTVFCYFVGPTPPSVPAMPARNN
ncbi:MAG: hypothetical protein ACKO1N_07975 [Erythrobacter sp.]